MAKRKQNSSNSAIFCSLLLAGVALLILPHKITRNLNSFFIELFRPVIGIDIKLPGKPSGGSLHSSGDYVSKSEYDHLWAAYQNLYADLLEAQKRLEEATKFRSSMPKTGDMFVMADIIKREQGQKILINRGSIDGVEKGQYAFAEGAIIGKVTDISSSWARVTLITNNTLQVPVHIVRPGREEYIRANMVGNGLDACKIPYISAELDVKPGDYVYASPEKKYLETPRIAGVVKTVVEDMEDPLIWDITVEPSADFEKLKKVAVIVVAPAQEVSQK
ncbi:rod shape-determining protein MreC [Sedimentisphaera salicampi]|uniref:Cell shape-determining protein MreC n=1 Tax=Sedimentisphaera salicampi TaxID=1941349 RepID=A0A1W6LPE6_9BACT|nr:rod shape-determining protein MreC [Sedimentisphaera salicampi]ARN57602.1 rod shape-determining protein MreC [Sedimentisphaera salicampi]OXU14348.1 rod shape-determining protein MreC [Sedimentisphaera salicampi]